MSTILKRNLTTYNGNKRQIQSYKDILTFSKLLGRAATCVQPCVATLIGINKDTTNLGS